MYCASQYATWEEAQKDFRRARSVWERGLDVNYRNTTFWLKASDGQPGTDESTRGRPPPRHASRAESCPLSCDEQYAEMEMRHRFINHARNIWDRAVTLLPRIDQLWYKYIHMEEMLGNIAGARCAPHAFAFSSQASALAISHFRQVFERWMAFEPDHQGWMAYIKFELRYNEVQRARDIFERYMEVLPSVKGWVRYAKFEMKNGDVAKARQCYERAVEALGEDGQTVRRKTDQMLARSHSSSFCRPGASMDPS